jgi:pimeloyl-ACP methyl ester carboxylesterase
MAHKILHRTPSHTAAREVPPPSHPLVDAVRPGKADHPACVLTDQSVIMRAMRLTDTVEGDGQPIVLLPSGAHTTRDYDLVKPALLEHGRVIGLEWPLEGPGSATLFADAVEEAVARLAPEGAVVIGNSIGGFSAARLALRRPGLVSGLVFVDGGGFLPPSLQARVFCSLMGRPWFLRAIYPAFAKRYMRARGDFDREVAQRATATARDERTSRTLAGLWKSFAGPEHDLRDRVEEIRVPTLVVWGRHDPVIPLKTGEWVAEHLPDAELVVLDTGHVPHASDPRAFAAAVVPFVKKALTRRAAA